MNNDKIDLAALQTLESHGRETATSITRLQERLEQINRILATPDIQFTYYVKTISLWASEGEEEAEARSKNLATAIKNAGKRHHEINKRSDWQVCWEVQVSIGTKAESILFPLPPEIYRSLLPGGESETRLRLRSTYHQGRHGC